MSDFDTGSADLRDRLVEAMIPDVPFDGWTRQGLEAAAVKLGLDPALARNAFPNGPADAVAHHSAMADRAMVADLTGQNLAALTLGERVEFAIRRRLERAEAEREAVRRAATLLALPANAPLGLKLLYATVDAVWRAVGDRSTDFSYYTKRASLAAVYGTTLAYWLQDDSEGRQKSWAFLHRRLGNVVQFAKAKAKVKPVVDAIPTPFHVFARIRDAMARNRGGV